MATIIASESRKIRGLTVTAGDTDYVERKVVPECGQPAAEIGSLFDADLFPAKNLS